MRILLKSWKRKPHQQVTELLHSLAAKEPKKQAKLLAALTVKPHSDTPKLWVCRDCGHGQSEWSLHCPACDAFDGQEWK